MSLEDEPVDEEEEETGLTLEDIGNDIEHKARSRIYHAPYSDEDKGMALTLLGINRYDFEKTSVQTGIPIHTLSNWNSDVFNQPKSIPAMLDVAINKLINNIPDKWNGNAWAVALGILMDKWLLLRGEATKREEVTKTERNVVEQVIEGIAKDPVERDLILGEITKLLAAAKSSGDSGDTSPTEKE
jgi:hypothetical protein